MAEADGMPSVRGRMFLGLIALAGLVGGGQGLYTAVTNTQPVEYAVADYLRDRPDTTWLSLRDAELDLTQAAYSRTAVVNTINELYVPIFTAGGSERRPVKLLLVTRDPNLIQTVQELEAASQDQATLLQFLRDNRDRLVLEGPVTGLVKFGITDLDRSSQQELESLYDDLAEDYVLIEADAKPDYLLSGGALLAGIALGTWVLLPVLKRKLASTA